MAAIPYGVSWSSFGRGKGQKAKEGNPVMPYMNAAGLAKLKELGVTEQDLKDWQKLVGAKSDGDPGPLTMAATIGWYRDRGFMKPPAIQSAHRSQVVAIAAGELGEQNPAKYYQTVAPMYLGTKPNEKAWCGVFALWCLNQAGVADWTWVDGKGFLYRLPTTGLPEPGDIAYFTHLSHHAIVERVGNGKVYTIDGNTMTAPKEGVTRKYHNNGEAVYYSIGRLAK